LNGESARSILERLEAIEAILLGLEHASEGGIDPYVAVRLLFREFRNLKSALSMSGAA
jgi:hypothetical protein